MRWARSGIAALMLVACSGAAPPLRDVTAKLPGGRRMHFLCAGTGTPTILFEGGWAADARAWGRVMPALAAKHRTCAYDRAGAGSSNPAAGLRDPAAIALDLDRALKAARIAGPFVLVGHSAGGIYVRYLQVRRPRDVVGMVLVDPSLPDQTARLEARFGPGAGSLAALLASSERCIAVAGGAPADAAFAKRCAVPPPADAAAIWRTRLAELRDLFVARPPGPLAERPGALGALPLVVLTAAKDRPPPVLDAYHAMHRNLASLSTRGVQRDVGESGHMMMIDQPAAIVAAVEEVAR